MGGLSRRKLQCEFFSSRYRQTRTPLTIAQFATGATTTGRATGATTTGRRTATAPFGPAHPALTTPRAHTIALALWGIKVATPIRTANTSVAWFILLPLSEMTKNLNKHDPIVEGQRITLLARSGPIQCRRASRKKVR
jgi:hypothetical protein